MRFEQERERLRSSLLEEIARIETHVAGLGVPHSMKQRALIARYGKLLFITQQLLNVLPKLKRRGHDQLITHPALAAHHPAVAGSGVSGGGRRAFRRDGRL
ncbi:MAG TPA: hypothetical protein ENI96_06690 [Sedimenticola thiotaurini]|uniref:Uncharacterized protein n=1 Tax=Sedimenticola thiotaurini TaxID=1543721 RepID=A0A831RP36_9GAMM|nr:hypothetical protein [Sedimenticola thiotaurini]